MSSFPAIPGPSITPDTSVAPAFAATMVAASPSAAVPVLSWPIFDGLDVAAVVTTRQGGVSAGRYGTLNLGLHVGDDPESVLINRRRAAAAVGARLDDLVFAEQVAGAGVAVVTQEHAGRGARTSDSAVPGVDVLITSQPGLVLVIMVADCVPLVLFDPVRRVLAAVHAGWAGTVRGVTSTAVEQLRALGSDPADLLVGVGPSIAPDRYQVGSDVVEAARTAFGSRVDEVVHPDGTGAWNFDLWQANLIQLTAAGVPASQVQIGGLDTGPGTSFFSHRSEGPCGRFAVLASIARRVRG